MLHGTLLGYSYPPLLNLRQYSGLKGAVMGKKLTLKEVEELLDQNKDRIEEAVREGEKSRKGADGCGYYDLDDEELHTKP